MNSGLGAIKKFGLDLFVVTALFMGLRNVHCYAADIRSFGAACNGVTDDVWAWYAAFGAALQSPHGDLVRMGAGCRSYISRTIDIPVPPNKVIGISGMSSKTSKIIVARGQDGIRFSMGSDGNYVMQPEETGSGVILRQFTIEAMAGFTSPSNTAIFIGGDTVAGTQTPASSINDVVIKGDDENSGWGTAVLIYRSTNFSIRQLTVDGILSELGVVVLGGAYNSEIYSVDAHISGYQCRSLNVCVLVQGQTQGVFIDNFDFENVNFGVQALGSIGIIGQSQNNIIVARGKISSRIGGVQLTNIPFWSVNQTNFRSASSNVGSSSVGLDLIGAMHGSATGNSFDMAGGLCARLRDNTYRVSILGGECKNALTGVWIDASSSDNGVTGVNYVNTGTRVVNYGTGNEIDQ